MERSGNNYLVGYNYTTGTSHELRLFRAVVPVVTNDDNATSLDFRNSYITTEAILSTDDYEAVHLFGRDCIDVDCQVTS